GSMRPLPERIDRRRRRTRQRLIEKFPGPKESGQRVRRKRWRRGLLGKLFAARIDGDRMVEIRGRGEAQLPVQPDLPRRRCGEARAAHNVRDAVVRVVHDHSELIREYIVRALDDEVADLAREVLLVPALKAISESDRAVAHGGAPCASLTARCNAVPAGARIDALAAGTQRRALEIWARARTGKRECLARKTMERGLVQHGALALPYDRAVVAKPVCRELGEDLCRDPRAAARLVEIFDANEPLAALRPGVAVARERR